MLQAIRTGDGAFRCPEGLALNLQTVDNVSDRGKAQMTDLLRCIQCSAEINADFEECPFCGEVVSDLIRRHRGGLLDGKYEILARLGEGGMGDVYKVRHIHLDSIRVVKVMRTHLTEDDDARSRFLREGRLATRVTHQNVATLHDFATLPDGSWYMVWEYIEGRSLREVIRSTGALEPLRAVQIARQTLNGLAAIHRAGIIHRDLSPDNLMLSVESDGVEHVKIIDLGIAKLDGDSQSKQTEAGIFIGKLRYASPEHLGMLPEGSTIDGRADIYSLGLVLYEMIVGAPALDETSPQRYYIRQLQEDPPPLAVVRPQFAQAPLLQPILSRAVEKDRAARFQTAREFADALDQIIPLLDSAQQRLNERTMVVEVSKIAAPLPLSSHQRVERDRDVPLPPASATTSSIQPPALHPPELQTTTPVPLPETAETFPAAPRRSRSKSLSVLLLGTVLAAGGVVTWLLIDRGPGEPQPAAAAPLEQAELLADHRSTPQENDPSGQIIDTVEAAPVDNEPAVDQTQTNPIEPAQAAAPPKPPPTQRAQPRTTTPEAAPAAAPPVEEVAPPAPEPVAARRHQIFEPKPRTRRFADSPEYRASFSRGIVPDYGALTRSNSVQWSWLEPSIQLRTHRFILSPFDNAAQIESAQIAGQLMRDLQNRIDGVTAARGGTIRVRSLIYSAEASPAAGPGIGLEMLFYGDDDSVVGMLRHQTQGRDLADAAEKMAQAVAAFIEKNR
jgi:eukaryotic-like serine/threonine-protein kinase